MRISDIIPATTAVSTRPTRPTAAQNHRIRQAGIVMYMLWMIRLTRMIRVAFTRNSVAKEANVHLMLSGTLGFAARSTAGATAVAGAAGAGVVQAMRAVTSAVRPTMLRRARS